MTIFALDTTAEVGSLALRRNCQVIAERTLLSPDGFAHVLFQALEDLLSLAGVRLSEIDCFAAASGPGSFTGVRVGLAAAKGLAEAEDKPAVAVSSLRAMSSFGTLRHRAVLLDAHRDEVYAAVYDEHLEVVSPEMVMKLAAWLDSLTVKVDELISFGNMLLPDTVRVPHTIAPRSLAGAVAYCAEIECKAGRCLDPAALDANYVRRPDAELLRR